MPRIAMALTSKSLDVGRFGIVTIVTCLAMPIQEKCVSI